MCKLFKIEERKKDPSYTDGVPRTRHIRTHCVSIVECELKKVDKRAMRQI